MDAGLENFPEISSMSGRATCNYILTHCPIVSSLPVLQTGRKCKFPPRLSFALLFNSVRALSAKITFSIFRSNSWRGTCNFQGGAIFVYQGTMKIYDSTFEEQHCRRGK
jgi:hypothetical protein